MQEKFTFFHTPKYKLFLSIANGLFLYLFLIIFLPFGVSNYDPYHEYTLKFLFELSAFIPVVFLASLFNEFVVKSLFKGDLDYGFIIGWTLWSILILGLIIFFSYNYMGDWHDWRLSSLPGFLINVATVLIFPMAGTFFYFRYKTLQEKYDAILTNTEGRIDKKQMLHFAGDGSKDKLSISVADFVYARAQDNYLDLYYLDKTRLSKFLIRSSMGRLSESLDKDFLVRCHRSYLINLYNVHSIKGSRNDLEISLSHTEILIPVSKTYVDDTLKKLRKYKRFQ